MDKSKCGLNSETLREIQQSMRLRYPNLNLIPDLDGKAQIIGSFPVHSPEGVVLDRFQISIELLGDYPNSLPIVREVGGRIPWTQDFHVDPATGNACVLLPDDRWRCFPADAPFLQFLDGPVHDFFLGQSLVALGEPWPFGEWSHGTEGILEYYQELFGTQDPTTIVRFLRVLGKLSFKHHWDCPCGSGMKIRKCCHTRIADLRRKIPPAVARKALRSLTGS